MISRALQCKLGYSREDRRKRENRKQWNAIEKKYKRDKMGVRDWTMSFWFGSGGSMYEKERAYLFNYQRYRINSLIERQMAGIVSGWHALYQSMWSSACVGVFFFFFCVTSWSREYSPLPMLVSPLGRARLLFVLRDFRMNLSTCLADSTALIVCTN